jgi:hypothetical protein
LSPHSHAQRQRRDEKGECLSHSIEIKNRAISEREIDQARSNEGLEDQDRHGVIARFNSV